MRTNPEKLFLYAQPILEGGTVPLVPRIPTNQFNNVKHIHFKSS